MMPRLPKPMLYALYCVFGLAAVAIAAGAVVLVVHVEDWGRDLTTNVAATDANARD